MSKKGKRGRTPGQKHRKRIWRYLSKRPMPKTSTRRQRAED